MTIIGATWCEDGVFVFADSKRRDVVTGAAHPEVTKLTMIVPWGTLVTGGPGTLGDAIRGFLDAVLHPFPPSVAEVLSECRDAMQYMYQRYALRTGSHIPLMAVFACIPPGQRRQIWFFTGAQNFAATLLPTQSPFWISATNTPLALEVVTAHWRDDVHTSRDAAIAWAGHSIQELSYRTPDIGLPAKMEFHAPSGEALFFQVSEPSDL